MTPTLPELEALLEESNSDWVYEDCVYRFYHQSFKVYGLQSYTVGIVQKLQALALDRELNPWFMDIVSLATGKPFSSEHKKTGWKLLDRFSKRSSTRATFWKWR